MIEDISKIEEEGIEVKCDNQSIRLKGFLYFILIKNIVYLTNITFLIKVLLCLCLETI